MRRSLSFVAAGVVALALAAPAASQDAPSYVDVQSITLAPEDTEAFLAQVKIVRDAAIEIGLDEKFRWDVYRWDDEVFFVGWHATLAELEDESAMAQAFIGTPAQEKVMAAFAATADMAWEVDRWLQRARPDLGHAPANPAVTPGAHGGLYVMEQWVKSAELAPAFEESVTGFMDMVAELGGGYPIVVNQDVTGDGGYNIVVVIDNLGNFFGPNAIEKRLAEQPAVAERWAAHAAEHMKLISRQESRMATYLPQYSYRPDLAGASTDGN